MLLVGELHQIDDNEAVLVQFEAHALGARGDDEAVARDAHLLVNELLNGLLHAGRLVHSVDEHDECAHLMRLRNSAPTESRETSTERRVEMVEQSGARWQDVRAEREMAARWRRDGGEMACASKRVCVSGRARVGELGTDGVPVCARCCVWKELWMCVVA